jgi:aldehyde dehydrogenase (NAD+)
MSAISEIPRNQLLIDGCWQDASSKRVFATINPATEELIAEVAEAGEEDVEQAVWTARRALAAGPWSRISGSGRARLLERLASLLELHADALVWLESCDAGKPVAATRRQDLAAAIDCLRYYAGWADKLTGEIVPTRPDALTYVHRVPVGVVAAIVPWNFPLMNAVWKVAPALACGCTVVLKPAELTPLSALKLGELALEAGIPPGVLNVVPGLGGVAGHSLVVHPLVDKVSFTGSPAVGKRIMAAAAPHCKRVTLELGGKSPNVVFDDADIESAVRASAAGIFFNAGQVCSAGSRILVQRSCYVEFVERLAKRAGGIAVGDPIDPATTMGPLISRVQQKRVIDYIEAGCDEGAVLRCGGHIPGNRGFFVEPTVFADVGNDMRIAREEIFGPVAAVIPFDTEEEGMTLANDNAYSLAAAVWTSNVGRAHRFAHGLRAGTVWVNTYGHTDTRLPWGGCGGDSGVGRDLGRAAIDNYTEARTVWIRLN